MVNVAIPNLIASDLVITKPMSSMSGYITYVKYSTATDKGETVKGTEFNSPFALKTMDSKYTGEAVVEAITSTEADMALVWGPVVKGAFKEFDGKGGVTVLGDVKIVAADGTVTYADLDENGNVPKAKLVEGGKVAYRYDNVIVPQNDLPRIKAEMVSIPLVAKA